MLKERVLCKRVLCVSGRKERQTFQRIGRSPVFGGCVQPFSSLSPAVVWPSRHFSPILKVPLCKVPVCEPMNFRTLALKTGNFGIKNRTFQQSKQTDLLKRSSPYVSRLFCFGDVLVKQGVVARTGVSWL